MVMFKMEIVIKRLSTLWIIQIQGMFHLFTSVSFMMRSRIGRSVPFPGERMTPLGQ